MIAAGTSVRRVVLVEDDNLTRLILAETLAQRGFEVQSAATAGEAEDLCAQFDPDAVVLDVDLGNGPNGFDLADSLRLSSPGIAILFLTHLPDSRFIGRDQDKLPAGFGYLNKDRLVAEEALFEALDSVLRGRQSGVPRHDTDPSRPMAYLSQAQISVLRMIALGMDNQQIATKRKTSVRAVYGLIQRAMAAIGAEEDAEGVGRVVAARAFIAAAGIPLNIAEQPDRRD